MWQRHWEERGRDFLMVGVAQDVEGAARVAPIVAERHVEFPIVLDPESTVGRLLGFRIVPAGFLVGGGVLLLRHLDDFDIADPRVRANLDAFHSGGEIRPVDEPEPMEPAALERFAEGVALYGGGQEDEALRRWREALALDPDNFLIRSQIWSIEHPEHFWPVVDREWQELQLLREGYDKPLP